MRGKLINLTWEILYYAGSERSASQSGNSYSNIDWYHKKSEVIVSWDTSLRNTRRTHEQTKDWMLESGKNIKELIKSKTRSSDPASETSKLLKLDEIIRGWVNYFKIANAKSNMQKLDEMVRTRLRIMTWRRWKRIRTKVINLVNLGIERSKAYMWGNTSKKTCRVSHSPILLRTLNIKYWRKAGYVGFHNYYSAWQTDECPPLF